ncbi:MAG: DUF1501 domain-containing protein [Planctomycetota bacterium]
MSLHNDPSNAQAFTRRELLDAGVKGAVFASAAMTVPGFLQQSAFGLPMPAAGMSEIAGVDTDRVLVVVQLSGGNDGLNTVVPAGFDAYYNARPRIALPQDEVLSLGRGGPMGLHRAMEGVKDLYDDGLCSIVQGVGYPNPNRSHFKSMDIWHTADTTGTGTGWIARYIDSQCCGYGAGESGRAPTARRQRVADLARATPDELPEPGIAIGRTAPLAMEGGTVRPVAFENERLFQWMGEDVHEALVEPYKKVVAREPDRTAEGSPAGETNADFLMRTAMNAQVSSDQIRRAVSQRPLVEYPRTDLGRQLQMVGSMIRAGLKTRVYYVSQGGFDTHAAQGGANGQHANLLAQFSGAVRAFMSDLQEQGNDQRTLVMSFSEFGRRVGENASGGTDHGTAAPMFLFGPMVRPGLTGNHPSLTHLDNGDLVYTTDFRTVYADVLKTWMGADPAPVVGRGWRPAGVVKA